MDAISAGALHRDAVKRAERDRVCHSRSTLRRFQDWVGAGVFHEILCKGPLQYDQVVGIDWAWLACDGPSPSFAFVGYSSQ